MNFSKGTPDHEMEVPLDFNIKTESVEMEMNENNGEIEEEPTKSDCVQKNKDQIFVLKYQCVDCIYKTNRKLNLMRHIKQCHSQFLCEVCADEFSTNVELKKHRKKYEFSCAD